MKFRLLLAGLATILLTAVDLGTKALAMRWLPASGRGPEVIEGFWSFQLATNRDVGFGLLSFIPPDIRRILIMVMVVIGLSAVTLFAIRRSSSNLALIGSALIASGALGNLIDRAVNGHVVDFVLWHYRDRFYWPIFNVADVCVVLGVACIFWLEWTDPGGKLQDSTA